MAALGQAKQYSSGGGQGAPQQSPPPPPRVEPYRDGISRSTQHYDLFEMIRNPHPSSMTRPPDPPAPGVLYEASLSKQFKIRRELEKQFYSSAKILAGPAKVVRFIFMVLFLPFYLILYKIPRLILTVVVNAIINKIKEYIHRLSNRISRFFERCVSLIKAPFIKIWEAVVREVELGEQPIEKKDHLDFFSFIAHGFVLLYQLIFNPIKYAVVTGSRLAVELYHYLRKVPGRCRAWYQEQIERVQSFKERLINACQNKIKELTKQLYDSTIGKLKRGLAWVDQSRERVVSKLLGYVPTFEFKLFYQTIDYVKSLRREISIPKIRLNFPLSRWNFDPVTEKYSDFKIRLNDLRDWIKSIKFTFSIKWPQFKFIQIPKINFKGYIYRQVTLIKRYGVEAVRVTLWALIYPFVALTERFKQVYNRISFPLTSYKPKITFPNLDRYFLPFKQAKEALVIKVENASMHVRFFIAWAHILVRYGIAQVKEIADSLI